MWEGEGSEMVVGRGEDEYVLEELWAYIFLSVRLPCWFKQGGTSEE